MSPMPDPSTRPGRDAALGGHETDPQAVIRRFGLSAEQGAALVAPDPDAIRRRAGLLDGPFAAPHAVRADDR